MERQGVSCVSLLLRKQQNEENGMKKKSLLAVAAAMIGYVAFAYTWTGGGNDGLWTTPANWGVTSGYPQNADDPIIFNGSATVSLIGALGRRLP